MTTTATLHDVDHADMLGAVAQLPSHLRSGIGLAKSARAEIARSWPSESHAGRATPRALVICGMGGSGVGADLLPAVFDTSAPVFAVKGYDLPPWVNDEDRVVCVSYSGNTAETLRCFDAAVARSVVAAVVTSGGELDARARAQEIPVVEIPGGLQPRAAVGLLFGALAGVAEALNVVGSDVEQVVERAAAGAQNVVDMHTASDGGEDPPALAMARQLHDTTVVVYGAASSVAVAHRWKAQINENGKVPAFANAYPELDHNEVVGWEHARAAGGRWSLVELLPPALDDALRLRMDVTRDIVADDLAADLRIEPVAKDRAGGLFELLSWGDYVSVYLALLRGVDPSPVDRITTLKQRLGGR